MHCVIVRLDFHELTKQDDGILWIAGKNRSVDSLLEFNQLIDWIFEIELAASDADDGENHQRESQCTA